MFFGQKMDDKSIGFLMNRSLNGNPVVEVKIKDGEKLWKKIDNEGIQLIERD